MRVFFKQDRDIVMRCSVVKLFILGLVCLFTNFSVSAEGWDWSSTDGGVYLAVVDNKAGNTFGQICVVENSSCYYFLYIDFSCDEGAEFPSLINSEHGAHSVSLQCAGLFKDGYLLSFNDFDQTDNIARKSVTLGVAVALESGKFAVNRFNLRGSSKTIDAMREAALQSIESNEEGAKAADHSLGSELL